MWVLAGLQVLVAGAAVLHDIGWNGWAIPLDSVAGVQWQFSGALLFRRFGYWANVVIGDGGVSGGEFQGEAMPRKVGECGDR
jgi:hypothetical protein